MLHRLFHVHPGEAGPLLAAALYFFFVLTALQIMRPARDAIGMERGLDEVRWLFIGTAVVTLAVNPLFGALVSRFRRLVFIAITYVFFAASLAGFWALITLAPDAVGRVSGRVFYVWFSVFNLFSTMVFWALMADRFTYEQSKRVFGVIAVGGTLGAITGPWLASVFAEALGTESMLLLAAVFLLLAIGAAWLVTRLQPQVAAGGESLDHLVIGGSAWNGVSAVLRSPYLLGISGYVLLMTVMATFLYFTRLAMVAAAADDTDARTTIFANIDFWTQVTTLGLQAVVTGYIMKRFGVAVALVLLPIAVSLGFLGLAIIGSFVVLTLFEATFRAIQRAVTRPARETLFTIVTREEKYKSKAFTDTFVYRGGDVAGAWTEGGLRALGVGLAGLTMVTIPLAVVWAVFGVWLGRTQQRQAALDAAEATRPGGVQSSLGSSR